MQVSVFHNIARDTRDRRINWFGYEPGHPLVHVLDLDVGAGLGWIVEAVAEEIWIIGNADPATLTGSRAAPARAYRLRRLRSLSKGDVLVIGDGGDRVAVCVDSSGSSPIDRQALQIIRSGEPGSRPWPADAPPIPGSLHE